MAKNKDKKRKNDKGGKGGKILGTVNSKKMKETRKKLLKIMKEQELELLREQAQCNHRHGNGKPALEEADEMEDGIIRSQCSICETTMISDPEVLTAENIEANLELIISSIEFIKFNMPLKKEIRKDLAEKIAFLQDLPDTFTEVLKTLKKKDKDDDGDGKKDKKGKGKGKGKDKKKKKSGSKWK